MDDSYLREQEKSKSEQDLLQHRMRVQLLRDIFHRVTPEGTSPEDINHYYCYHLLPAAYNLILLRIIPRGDDQDICHTEVLRLVEERMRKMLQPVFHEMEVSVVEARIICLFNITSSPDSPDTDYFKLAIGRFFSEISTSPEFSDYDFIMGEGAPVLSVTDLNLCFQSAVQAMEYGVVYGLNRRYDSYELIRQLGDIMSVLSTERMNQLRHSVENLDLDRVRRILRDVFLDSDTEVKKQPGLAYRMPHRILDLTASTIRDIISPTEEFEQLLQKHRQRIDDCFSLDDLAQITEDAVTELCNYYEYHSTPGQSPAVLSARRYIQEHYAEKISLKELAEHVQLNFQYLSVLFKRSTGVSVTDYIADIRIEHAKFDLKNTNDSVQNIANAVGYEDPRYFSRVFHNRVGLSPSAYRAKIRTQ